MRRAPLAAFLVLALAVVATSFEHPDAVVPEGGLHAFMSTLEQVPSDLSGADHATLMIQQYMHGCDLELPASVIQSLPQADFDNAVHDVARLNQMNADCALVDNLIERVDGGHFDLDQVAEEIGAQPDKSAGVDALRAKLLGSYVAELLDVDRRGRKARKKKRGGRKKRKPRGGRKKRTRGRKKKTSGGWFSKLKSHALALKKRAITTAKALGKKAIAYGLKAAKRLVCSKLQEAEEQSGGKLAELEQFICSKIPPKLAKIPMATEYCKKAIRKAAAHGIQGLNQMCGYSPGEIKAPAAAAKPVEPAAAAKPAAAEPAAADTVTAAAPQPAAKPAESDPVMKEAKVEEKVEESRAQVAGEEAMLDKLDKDIAEKKQELENTTPASLLDDRMLDVLLERY